MLLHAAFVLMLLSVLILYHDNLIDLKANKTIQYTKISHSNRFTSDNNNPRGRESERENIYDDNGKSHLVK